MRRRQHLPSSIAELHRPIVWIMTHNSSFTNASSLHFTFNVRTYPQSILLPTYLYPYFLYQRQSTSVICCASLSVDFTCLPLPMFSSLVIRVSLRSFVFYVSIFTSRPVLFTFLLLPPACHTILFGHYLGRYGGRYLLPRYTVNFGLIIQASQQGKLAFPVY